MTALLIMLKGTAAGLAAGLVYRALERQKQGFGNIRGCCSIAYCQHLYFCVRLVPVLPPCIQRMGKNADSNVFLYFFTFVIGLNFIIELLTNVILSPVIVRIVDIVRKNKS